MKKNILFIFLSFWALILHAQDYLINFSGTGSSTTVETVTVENLTQGKSITLSGLKTLHLVGTVTGNSPLLEYMDYPMIVYPNPSSGDLSVQFEAQKSGMVTVTIYDLIGREINQLRQNVQVGFQSFRVAGLSNGVYTLQVLLEDQKFTQKVVCKNQSNSVASISYSGFSEAKQNNSTLKSATDQQAWQYNTGDRLKFQGTSGKYSTIVMDVPTQSKILSFDFVECTDTDGNNYPVVKIGNQLWMAENLKTTMYNDGTSIPTEKDNLKWANLNEGAYCWYNNDINNKTPFGALYNWFAVGTDKLAPKGWHVPTNVEWSEFITFLGGENEAGGKLKEISEKYWASPNTGATNEVGFTALPSSCRSVDKQNSLLGDFYFSRAFSFWWSSDVFSNCEWANVKELGYHNQNIYKVSRSKQYGCSVRCIKDSPENPTPKFVSKTANYKGINLTVGNIQNNLNFRGNYYHDDELIVSFTFDIRDNNNVWNHYQLFDNTYVLFDYNNDGYLDLFGFLFNYTPVWGRNPGKYILVNNALGSSEKKTYFFDSDISFSGEMGIGDFNNDGIKDVVFASNNTHHDNEGLSLNQPKPVKLFFFNKDGTFKEINATKPISVANMASGDIDNDGDVDLLVWEYGTSQKPQLYLNDGSANFTEAPMSNFNGLTEIMGKWKFGFGISSVELFDIDGDGDLDIIIGSTIGGKGWDVVDHNNNVEYKVTQQRIYWGNGTGKFDLLNNYTDLPNNTIEQWSFTQPDYNDLVTYYNTKIKTAQGFNFIDYNNDGYYDILTAITPNYGGYILQIHENLGNRTFKDVTKEIIDNYNGTNMGPINPISHHIGSDGDFPYFDEIRPFDIDGDGDLDLVPHSVACGEGYKYSKNRYWENIGGKFMRRN